MRAPDAEPAPTRRRLPGDQRRHQILAAAREVFLARGLQGARTKDIAAAAGITEALVYRHFASKDELFEAAVVAPLEAAVAKLVLDSGEPPAEVDTAGTVMVERTRVFVRDLVEVLEESAPLLGAMLFGDVTRAPTRLRDHVTPFLERTSAVVATNLDWWPHRDFDPQVLTRVIFGGVWFETLNARLTGAPLDKDRLADELSRLVVHGLIQDA